MTNVRVNNLDYLAARLHGRRSRMAEAERLEALSHLQDVCELGRAVYPNSEYHSALEFQRRLAQDLLQEICGFLRHLEGPGGELLAWMLVRFQVENMKVLLRHFIHRTPLEREGGHLLSLPPDLALDAQGLGAAVSLEEFTERLPSGTPRRSLQNALVIHHEQPRLFFLEAALDHGYFQELLVRTDRLAEEDKQSIKPIVLQEVDAFHLMLAIRGKLHLGLPPALLALHIRCAGIPSQRFEAMLAAPDLLGAARLAVGRAIDALPSERESSDVSAARDATALEALAWRRFLRLSNHAFRHGLMGLGTVVGYVGLRRVEVANLITLSEGVRTGTAIESIRRRLIPRSDLETAYV